MHQIMAIGVGKYESSLPDLTAAADAGKLCQVLTDNWLPQTDIRADLIEDSSGTILTPETIRTALDRFSKQVEQDDSVVLYWTGHLLFESHLGNPDSKVDKLFLASGKSDPENPYPSSLSTEEIFEILMGLPVKETVLILDIYCASEIVEKFINLLHEKSGYDGNNESLKAVLSSYHDLQSVHDDPNYGYSAFTQYFLEVLRGEDGCDERGTVTLGHAYRYVIEKAAEKARKRLPRSQRPVLEPLLNPAIHRIALTQVQKIRSNDRPYRIVDLKRIIG